MVRFLQFAQKSNVVRDALGISSVLLVAWALFTQQTTIIGLAAMATTFALIATIERNYYEKTHTTKIPNPHADTKTFKQALNTFLTLDDEQTKKR